MEHQNQGGREHEQDPESNEAKYGKKAASGMLPVWFGLLTLFLCLRSICPESLFFPGLEEEKKPNHSSDSTLELSPDVDLLLQCSFSYMHQGAECDGQEQKPEEDLLNRAGPEEDKEEVGFSSSVLFERCQRLQL